MRSQSGTYAVRAATVKTKPLNPGEFSGVNRWRLRTLRQPRSEVDAKRDLAGAVAAEVRSSSRVDHQEVRQTFGIGWWSTTGQSGFCSSPVTEKCNPTITQEVTHATSGSDYNRFYLRAWDALQTYQGSTPCANKTGVLSASLHEFC